MDMDDGEALGPDGAASGITANDALGFIVGGKQLPPKEKRVDPAEFLDTCPMPNDWSERAVEDFSDTLPGGGYTGHARIMGKLFLDFMREHPECEAMPAESKYDWSRFHGEGRPPILQMGVGDYVKEQDPERSKKLDACGATGFSWGWAVNAARTAMGWGPVSNPAIMSINVESGQSLAEYALILALIAISAVVAMLFLSSKIVLILSSFSVKL
jgi:hypothetical protein